MKISKYSLLAIFLPPLLLLPAVQAFCGESGSGVVAMVGDEQITRADIDREVGEVPAPFRSAFEIKALEKMIDTMVFSRMALREGLDKTPGFKKALDDEMGRFLAEYYVKKKIREAVSVSPGEIETYYRKKRKIFSRGDALHLMEITAATRADARALEKRLDNGEPFDSLGRDLGWLVRGRMSKAFEKAAFSLEKGGVSPLFQTDRGFHMVKLLDRRPGGATPLETVKERIEKKLKEKKIASVKKIYRERAEVRIVDRSIIGKPGKFPGPANAAPLSPN